MEARKSFLLSIMCLKNAYICINDKILKNDALSSILEEAKKGFQLRARVTCLAMH